ncbi:MAG: HNH endonuclease [Tannerellaceae bacterium]|jgi:5-methylcytosine-specific restriction protein A|nr:HNH endonuclease [Tannerellaceae bacterium]
MPTINKPNRKKNNKGNQYDKERRKIYNSERWRTVRRLKFATNPLCEICERNDLTVPAEDIHHITSFMSTDDPEARYHLAYDFDNLLSLCKVCHQKVHNKHNRNE